MGVPFADTAFSTTGARPAEVTGTNGTTWTFVTSASGAIEASSLPSGSSTWSALSSLGGGTWSGYPGAMVTTSGNILVFGLQAGNLYYDKLASGSTTWSGWTELGNPGDRFVGTPTAVEDRSSDIWVFTRDSVSGHLYADELPDGSTTWSGFTNLTGTFPNDPSVVVGEGGTMTVVGIGNNSAVYQDDWSTSTGWTGWTEISGATVTGSPVIIINPSNVRYLFARQLSNGALMTNNVGGRQPARGRVGRPSAAPGTSTQRPSPEAGARYRYLISAPPLTSTGTRSPQEPGTDGAASAAPSRESQGFLRTPVTISISWA